MAVLDKQPDTTTRTAAFTAREKNTKKHICVRSICETGGQGRKGESESAMLARRVYKTEVEPY